MKIAIVGAGWIGCHLANRFKSKHTVTIYEQKEVFGSTSFINQNRLHLGFHYARSFFTRELCLNTFDLFISDYQEIVSNVYKNFYCVPDKKSIIDFNTYVSIFNKNNFKYEICDVKELLQIEGSILVYEKYIDPWKSKAFFEKALVNNLKYEKIDENKLSFLKLENDIVINCTNNTFEKTGINCFYELCIMLKYKKIRETSFNAITLVDGDFFSIYPYKDDVVTLSSVKNTPIKTFEKYELLIISKSKIVPDQKLINLFEESVLFFYPEFKNDFKYDGYLISSKTKNVNGSSNRNPVVTKKDNVISCYTGKIQGIYTIEKKIRELCNEH